jgi:hypothetical protein
MVHSIQRLLQLRLNNVLPEVVLTPILTRERFCLRLTPLLCSALKPPLTLKTCSYHWNKETTFAALRLEYTDSFEPSHVWQKVS